QLHGLSASGAPLLVCYNLDRMVLVQTHGCNPIKLAFENGQDDVEEPFAPVTTVVPGVRVPKPLGGRLIIDVLRASGGHACAVSDDEVMRVQAQIAAQKGINLCPEGAACWAAYGQDVADGKTGPGETSIIFNTATGLKWPMPEVELSTASREAVACYMEQIVRQK
ncbi:MAG: pyridoxal-phosphate dependent enzyme, partial [Rhizobiales bacterium]|nr:pyridoxal-phosphate dependent enzyme [Hyphomicrobiales bacterium]